MVLLYNSRLDKQWSKKLDNRWNSPYLINDLKESRGTYLLEELDGTVLEGVFPGERLKRFFPRRGVDNEQRVDNEEEKDINEEGEVNEAEKVVVSEVLHQLLPMGRSQNVA